MGKIVGLHPDKQTSDPQRMLSDVRGSLQTFSREWHCKVLVRFLMQILYVKLTQLNSYGITYVQLLDIDNKEHLRSRSFCFGRILTPTNEMKSFSFRIT